MPSQTRRHVPSVKSWLVDGHSRLPSVCPACPGPCQARHGCQPWLWARHRGRADTPADVSSCRLLKVGLLGWAGGCHGDPAQGPGHSCSVTDVSGRTGCRFLGHAEGNRPVLARSPGLRLSPERTDSRVRLACVTVASGQWESQGVTLLCSCGSFRLVLNSLAQSAHSGRRLVRCRQAAGPSSTEAMLGARSQP